MNEKLNYLQTFNPIESKPELLEKTLIGRKYLADILENLVIESTFTGNKHQRLIIGPRGSGKTHMFGVLYNRVSTNDKLKDKLRIAYLCEDEYGIANLFDFIRRLFMAFIKWDPENSRYLMKEIENLKTTPLADQEKTAIHILLNHIKDRTLLIIVENIGDIFNGIGDKGQKKLRDLIHQYPVFTIMASNQALFQDIQNEDKPFLNFFKITHLQKLTRDETIRFITSISEWEKRDDLLQFLSAPEGIGRINAIYDITGGNHRLLVTFYDFLKIDYKNKLSQSFIETINNLTPYYQSFMKELPPQQQKIVQYLCQIRNPSNVKDIAQNCFAAPNTISKQMSNLVRLKYVDAHSSGKETFYELSEPLLRICFEVKENRSGPIKLFVDFLGSLYSATEIKKKYMHYHLLSKTCQDQEFSCFHMEQLYYKETLKQYFPDDFKDVDNSKFEQADINNQIKSYIKDLEKSKEYNDIIEFTSHIHDKDKYLFVKEAGAYIEIGETEKAIETAKTLLKENKNDVAALLVLGKAALKDKDHKKATNYLIKAIKNDSGKPLASYYLGQLFMLQDNYKEAEACFLTLLEKDPNNVNVLEDIGITAGLQNKNQDAYNYLSKLTKLKPNYSNGWRLLGLALSNLNKPEEAKKNFLKSIELDKKNTKAIENLGSLFGSLKEYQEACNYFTILIKIKPDYSEGWRLRGAALSNLNKPEEAKESFLKSIELDEKNTTAIENLGILLTGQKEYKEAYKYFTILIKIKPDYSEGWRLRGVALSDLNKPEEAKENFLKSIELDKKNATAIENFGCLFGRQEEYQEAFKYFTKLTKLEPDYSEGWRLRGAVLEDLNKPEEAKENFLKSIELDNTNTTAIENIGILLGRQKEHQKAYKYFTKLTKLKPDYSNGWQLLGSALYNSNKIVEAKKNYLKAIELDENNTKAVENLGILFNNQKKYADAIKYFTKLTQFKPDYSNGWQLLGSALYNLNKIVEAKKNFIKAIELDKNNSYALLGISQISVKTGDLKSAEEYINKILAAIPDNLYILNSIGEIYRESNQFERAIPFYEQAIILDPKCYLLNFNIASCYVGLNNTNLAIKALDKALVIVESEKIAYEIVECFEEILTTLFIHASENNISQFLNAAITLVEKHNLSEQFFTSIPSTIFNLLIGHDEIELKRFEWIEKILNNATTSYSPFIVPVKFLNIGIRHLKKNEKNVLFQFTKEERATLKKFVLDKLKV